MEATGILMKSSFSDIYIVNEMMIYFKKRKEKNKIFGQARRPAPTKACSGDSLWWPVSKKFDFDGALKKSQMYLQ